MKDIRTLKDFEDILMECTPEEAEELLAEMRTMNEGLWDNVKSGLSKFLADVVSKGREINNNIKEKLDGNESTWGDFINGLKEWQSVVKQVAEKDPDTSELLKAVEDLYKQASSKDATANMTDEEKKSALEAIGKISASLEQGSQVSSEKDGEDQGNGSSNGDTVQTVVGFFNDKISNGQTAFSDDDLTKIKEMFSKETNAEETFNSIWDQVKDKYMNSVKDGLYKAFSGK